MLSQRYVDLLAGNIYPLSGSQSFTSTTGGALIIVPVGRYWDGVITITCTAGEDAAGLVEANARGNVQIASSAGSYPANNAFVLVARAAVGANAASGLVGDASAVTASIPIVLYAGTTGSLQVNLNAVVAGSIAEVNGSAAGVVF